MSLRKITEIKKLEVRAHRPAIQKFAEFAPILFLGVIGFAVIPTICRKSRTSEIEDSEFLSLILFSVFLVSVYIIARQRRKEEILKLEILRLKVQLSELQK